MNHQKWLEKAIQLAAANAAKGEGPFAAIVVKDGVEVASGVNQVSASHDPTAHAELSAIREACVRLGRSDLSDCVLYASGEPCPMCMGAIYWARPSAVYYACGKVEAAEATGFGDPLSAFYAEMASPPEKRSIPLQKLDVPSRLEPFIVYAGR
jgi:guanine deaminase